MTLVVEVHNAAPLGLGAIGIPVVTGPAVFPGVALPEDLGLPAGLFDGGYDFSRRGFSGAARQILLLAQPGSVPDVVLIGLGTAGDDGLDAEQWRRAAADFVRAVSSAGTAALLLPIGARRDVGQAVAEGAVLAAYRYDEYRGTPRPGLEKFVVLPTGDTTAECEQGTHRGRITSGAVAWARDLINCPPSRLTPTLLADRMAARLATCPHTAVDVWDEDRIRDERLGGLLGVSQGSTEPPRLVRAEYNPESTGQDQLAHVVLVGKGITFDSGGLSLKTADGMVSMKTDMTGAAVVMAALAACAEVSLQVRVTAIAPIAENMPGGSAIKPGDVLTIRNGATIEVLNTDAEGRLVLADGLSLAAEIEPAPNAIVDVATLTGAASIALGNKVGALFGNNDALIAALEAAAASSGEHLWHLPMPDDYADAIDSDIADMRNIGKGPPAGAITAAMLLERFTNGLPWAHLDIAGPGRSSEASGYLSKGATAFGARTLVELVSAFASKSGSAPVDDGD